MAVTLDEQVARGDLFTLKRWDDVKSGDVVLAQGGLMEVVAVGLHTPDPGVFPLRMRALSNDAELELFPFCRWLTAVRVPGTGEEGS